MVASEQRLGWWSVVAVCRCWMPAASGVFVLRAVCLWRVVRDAVVDCSGLEPELLALWLWRPVAVVSWLPR